MGLLLLNKELYTKNNSNNNKKKPLSLVFVFYSTNSVFKKINRLIRRKIRRIFIRNWLKHHKSTIIIILIITRETWKRRQITDRIFNRNWAREGLIQYFLSFPDFLIEILCFKLKKSLLYLLLRRTFFPIYFS